MVSLVRSIDVEMDGPSDDVAMKCVLAVLEEARIKVLVSGFDFREGGYVRVPVQDFDRAMRALNLESLEDL